MPGPPEYRCTIPASGDRAYRSDVQEAELTGDHFSSTNEWTRFEMRTKGTYFLLGCAILLPWNAFINETPFFLSRLTGSPFYPTFSSSLSSVYTWTKLVCQFYCTITSKQSSPSRRIFVSIIAMMLSVASLCLSTFIQSTTSTFFFFVLFNGISLGVSAAYLCTAASVGASLLGPSFLQTMLSGQGASAVATSAVQVVSSIISLWGSSPKSLSMEVGGADGRSNQAEETAARMFFGFCAVYLCITFVAYTWLIRQPFYKSATRTLERHHEVQDADERTRLITSDCRNPQTEAESRVYHVLKDNLIFFFSAAYVFTVTIAVFPAITVRVKSVNPGIHPLLFTAVHVFVFSTGDLVGRYTCSLPCLRVWSAKKLLAMALSRTLFVPLILLCNIPRSEATTLVSPVINSDIPFVLILLTMGYTNGFVITRIALTVSSLEHNPRLKGRREDVGIAAALAGSFTVLGLACGALCSFGVQAMI